MKRGDKIYWRSPSGIYKAGKLGTVFPDGKTCVKLEGNSFEMPVHLDDIIEESVFQSPLFRALNENVDKLDKNC